MVRRRRSSRFLTLSTARFLLTVTFILVAPVRLWLGHQRQTFSVQFRTEKSLSIVRSPWSHFEILLWRTPLISRSRLTDVSSPSVRGSRDLCFQMLATFRQPRPNAMQILIVA